MGTRTHSVAVNGEFLFKFYFHGENKLNLCSKSIDIAYELNFSE